MQYIESSKYSKYFLENLTFVFLKDVRSPPEGTYSMPITDRFKLEKDSIGAMEFGINEDLVHQAVSFRVIDRNGVMVNEITSKNAESRTERVEFGPKEWIVSAQVDTDRSYPINISFMIFIFG